MGRLNASGLRQVKHRTAQYEARVRAAFGFLEEEFSFQFVETVAKDARSPRDGALECRYLSINATVVGVRWDVGENNLGVDVYSIGPDGEIPEHVSFEGDPGLPPAVSLDSLVEQATGGKVKSPLPEIVGEMSFAEACRRADERQRRIQNSFDELLGIYAERLRTYGAEILKGGREQLHDVSILNK